MVFLFIFKCISVLVWHMFIIFSSQSNTWLFFKFFDMKFFHLIFYFDLFQISWVFL